MRPRGLAIAGSLVVAACAALLGLVVSGAPSQTASPAISSNVLRPVSAFANIGDPHARAVALFEEAGKVLTHARCVNCHPASDRPRQTDARRPHQPLVVRGADSHGAPGMACAACHHASNFDPAHVPGHPEWHLAPVFAWIVPISLHPPAEAERRRPWPPEGPDVGFRRRAGRTG